MTDSERGYTIVRHFDVPREYLWRAWTDPEQFARWWGTAQVDVVDVDLDVRDEGEWRATMILQDGRQIPWSGTYIEVRPMDRLVVAFTDVPDGDEYDYFTVTFAERDGGTEMTLRQWGGHLTDEQYEEARVGTNSFLDEMETLVRDQLKMRHDS